MTGKWTGARARLRFGTIVLAAAVAVVAIGSDTADARSRRKRAPAYTPPYAAIVVDANSGQVLHATNADATRHPASITKIMTLYLLFEQLEAGRLKLDSELPVSSHAASQAPSKLGLRPGQSIEVEDAIKALVTKSANDVAVVVAEAVGGNEDAFARMMTRKAKSLGMNRTVYANASGLPDSDQITTARDQALLGRAIQERFPRYYRYFSTPSFRYHGRAMRNHNRLLGQLEGLDGIKTGYIRASGFNLVASMRRNGRHLVAVVMGGSSGRARDVRMAQLLETNVRIASVRRTAPMIAEAASARQEVAAAAVPMPVAAPQRAAQKPMVIASALDSDDIADAEPPTRGIDLPARAAPPARPAGNVSHVGARHRVEEGSADPIKPILVRTVSVKRGGAVSAAAPVRTASAGDDTAVSRSAPPTTRGGWIIQVGAFPEEGVARDRLKAVKSAAKSMLSSAEPFTMRVVVRDATLYRARFAGLDRTEAQAACKYLKRNEIACLAIKN